MTVPAASGAQAALALLLTSLPGQALDPPASQETGLIRTALSGRESRTELREQQVGVKSALQPRTVQHGREGPGTTLSLSLLRPSLEGVISRSPPEAGRAPCVSGELRTRDFR